MPASNATSVPAAIAYETYHVLAADVTYHYQPQETQRFYVGVLVSARDADQACERARSVLDEGLTPIAAFCRADLTELMRQMDESPLALGRVHNLDTGETFVAQD